MQEKDRGEGERNGVELREQKNMFLFPLAVPLEAISLHESAGITIHNATVANCESHEMPGMPCGMCMHITHAR